MSGIGFQDLFNILDKIHLFCENLESDQCLTTDQTYDASWEIIQAINVSIEAPLHWLTSQSIVEDIQGKERWEIFL